MGYKENWQALRLAILKTIREFDGDISVGFACGVLDDVRETLEREACKTSVKGLGKCLAEIQRHGA